MTAAMITPGSRWSLPAFLLVGSFATIIGFVLMNPPVYRASAIEAPSHSQVPAMEGGADALDEVEPLAVAEMRPQILSALTTVVSQNRANRVLLLRVGPDENYRPVGQIGSGARVDVVGRNEAGDWLAISLTPGSKTYGWVRATAVSGLTKANISALPVAAVQRMP